MIGTWKWNVYIALMAMGITFLSSLANNEWLTSFKRGIYGFAIIFAAVYAVRFLLGTVAGFSRFSGESYTLETNQGKDSSGNAVNLSTPADEELLNDLLKQQLVAEQGSEGFTPLQPQRLVSKEKVDPELLADALRHMSEE